jgi:4-hydroxybenzoate polyprenyltransferase
LANLHRLNEELVVTDYLPVVTRSYRRFLAWVASLRPHQWVKNSLVFSGLIFSGSLVRKEAVWISLTAFLIFCLGSSGVYLLNDLRDLEADRRHPVKRLRPLAAGTITRTAASVSLIILLVSSITVALLLHQSFGLVFSLYLLLSIAYSLGLKQIVILDVMVVASGFVLRAVAGAIVIGVQASHWLILCTLMLALLVAFGKRRQELILLNNDAPNHRAILGAYTTQLLDLMMAITSAASVITYSLYTMASETVARVGSRNLILTVPFVLYGVFRYLYLVHRREGKEDPARLFVTDLPMLVNALLWVIAVCFIIYGPRGWTL